MYGGLRGSALLVLLHLQLPFFHCLDKQDWDEEARYDKNKESMKQAVSFTDAQNREHYDIVFLCSEHENKHHHGKRRVVQYK